MATNSLDQPQVVCPHCWHRFYADKACFVSRHAELLGDEIAGDLAQKRFAPHEVSFDREKNALDPRGWRMIERACPRCHLQIPRGLLKTKPSFISVVGAPRAGKSHFLTAMIHQLRRELPRAFGYAWTEADSHDVKAFLEYENALFGGTGEQLTFVKKTEEEGDLYNHPRIDGVAVKLPKPFIFSLHPADAANRHNGGEIVLYDNAGESFDYLREQKGECVTQHLEFASAVLFAYDPLQDPVVRQRLSIVSNDPQLSTAAFSYPQEQILNETINRMRRYRNSYDRPLQTTLLVCVQKYDVWRAILPGASALDGFGGNGNVIDHTSVEIDPESRVGSLDVDEINRISLLVRSFLDDTCPQFVAQAESNFMRVRYFPISALGTSPEYEESGGKLLKVRSSKLQPFRVSHPLLWLMHRTKLIPRLAPDAGTQYPAATVLSTQGGLRVQMPTSRLVLNLDSEYAGTWIIDAHSGERVSIPAVARSPAKEVPVATPSRSVAPASPSAETHGLRLPDQPQRKRGWFTRK
jgi:hypothetical protein